MPMQPRPMADTSRLLLPSLRFCIDVSVILCDRPISDRIQSMAIHHSMLFRSRKNPPVGPSSGSVASQTAVLAASSGVRVAPSPPNARPHPTGTHRINLDRGRKLLRESYGEGVERSFRHAIG